MDRSTVIARLRDRERKQTRSRFFNTLVDDGAIPGKMSGAWVLKGTRVPVQTIFGNPEAGLSVKEITEVFDVTEQEVRSVLHFATQSLEKVPTYG